jgi:uncharacterized protein
MSVCTPAKGAGAPGASQYRIISGCSRLDVSTATWAGRIPVKWREHRPHRLRRGNQATLIDEWPLHRLGPSGDIDSYGEQQTIGMLDEQADSPDLRLRAQDLDGLDAEIIFTDPYGPGFLGMVESQDSPETMCAHPIFTGFWRGVRDDEAYKAWVRAYNEFLAEEYCSSCPRRLIGIGVLPDTGVDDALGEMENCARQGLKGIALHRFPSGRGYPTPDDDRFWEAACGLGMPVSFLPDRGRGTLRQAGAPFRHALQQIAFPEGRTSVPLLSGSGENHPIVPLQLAHAGVFDRFPQLRAYFAEWQPGWPPEPISQVDETYERTRYWAGRSRLHEPMEQPPSFYLRKNCLWSFLNDPHIVDRREDIGVRSLVWGGGFARATGSWPHLARTMEGCFAGVPKEERHDMVAGNVIDFFHLPEKSERTRSRSESELGLTAESAF